ncbi:dihydroneopterin aldolase [Lentibacillus saliphilus]|uniref:dihydroneopterin aldolase n=1 Tax=Lentibacillus saliphilus TaxID=2737028 RepID=UPI001C300224|nr:dihydroneopterin aldolase [Lentibacillus saliphilus]
MDKIILKEMAFYGYHGLFPQENHLGQRFYVDLELHVDVRQAAATDDMNASINYGTVYNIVKDIVEGEAKKLIETLAETIANALFETFDQLKGCVVKVTKPDAPIPGHFASVAVEISRERSL